MRELAIGLGLAIVSCIVLTFLPIDKAREAVAMFLVLIAAIYVGMALASNGTLSLPKQIAGCVFFLVCALLGLWVNWWFLVAGLALHGGWDILHHDHRSNQAVPQWYIPFCALYDVILAIFVAVFFIGGF